MSCLELKAVRPLKTDYLAVQVAMGDLLTGKQHIEAALRMVALRGGLAALDTNGFLRDVIETFSRDERTE